MGRLTRDPEIRYTNSQTGDNMCVARFTLAVDRRFVKKGGNEQTADFISCVAFGKQGEFVEKYLKQGTKIAAVGRIQTGSYTNKDGQKIYTTDVIVEEMEFAESKKNNTTDEYDPQPSGAVANFMEVGEDLESSLPFGQK